MGSTCEGAERLKDAALDPILDDSFGAFIIHDICQRVEINEVGFHCFFYSNAAVSVAALERMWATRWKLYFDAKF